MDEIVAATTFLTVKARVARALLELAKYIGRPSSAGHIVFHERISQADLAAMAGVARENVSRVLSEWRQKENCDRIRAPLFSQLYCRAETRNERRSLSGGRPFKFHWNIKPSRDSDRL